MQKVSLWKKVHVIYSFFFIRKIIAHISTFVFYCIVLPATVVVPEVAVPKWGSVYIPSLITLLNAVGTPRSDILFCFCIWFFLNLLIGSQHFGIEFLQFEVSTIWWKLGSLSYLWLTSLLHLFCCNNSS